MRFVSPDVFKTVGACADAFVQGLAPPEARDWLPFLRKDWASRLDSDLAAQTIPGKLWFARPGVSGRDGILTVFVASQGAALVLQHEVAMMRDAVNSFYQQDLLQTIRLQVQKI